MKQLIAIEPDLTPIKDFLTDKGYKVDSINACDKSFKNTEKYDAFIVNGLDTNSLGFSDTTTRAVVINADGLTAEQVYKELKSKLD